MDQTLGGRFGLGEIAAGVRDDATGAVEWIARAANSWMYSYAYLVCKCVGQGDFRYQPAYFYVEYDNVATPTTPATTPTVNASDTVASYYGPLVSSPTRDFLRIPAWRPDIQIATGFEPYYAAPQGNMLVFAGMTGGLTQGVLGRPFGATSNSKVCGVALVAAPVIGDWTQDILWGRSYFQAADQFIPAAGKSAAVGYNLTFPL